VQAWRLDRRLVVAWPSALALIPVFSLLEGERAGGAPARRHQGGWQHSVNNDPAPLLERLVGRLEKAISPFPTSGLFRCCVQQEGWASRIRARRAAAPSVPWSGAMQRVAMPHGLSGVAAPAAFNRHRGAPREVDRIEAAAAGATAPISSPPRWNRLLRRWLHQRARLLRNSLAGLLARGAAGPLALEAALICSCVPRTWPRSAGWPWPASWLMEGPGPSPH